MANSNGNINIWLVVGSILAALFGAIVGGFIRDWVVEKFFRPKLFILDWSVFQGMDLAHYRVMVKNGGRRAADNCIGVVTLDSKREDIWEEHKLAGATGGPLPILSKEYFAPIETMSLCWTPRREFIVINRDAEYPLELCMVLQHSQGPSIKIPCSNGYEPFFGAELKGSEKYHGQIKVTASNADPAWAEFKMVPQDGNVNVEIVKRVPDWDDYQLRWTRRVRLRCKQKIKVLGRSKQDARTKEKA